MKLSISLFILGFYLFRSLYLLYINDKLFEVVLLENGPSLWHTSSVLFPIGFIFWDEEYMENRWEALQSDMEDQ